MPAAVSHIPVVTTVYQRLRDERGLNVSIASFRRYVLATMPDRDSLRGQVTVRKPDPPPGEEAQIDYGYLGPVDRPPDGPQAPGVGVRDGAERLPAPVRAPGGGDALERVGRGARGRARLLRRGAPQVGDRQPQGQCDLAGPV
jgi:hypothetical protein